MEEHAKFAQLSWELGIVACDQVYYVGMILDDLLGWNFEGEVKYTRDTDLELG